MGTFLSLSVGRKQTQALKLKWILSHLKALRKVILTFVHCIHKILLWVDKKLSIVLIKLYDCRYCVDIICLL